MVKISRRRFLSLPFMALVAKVTNGKWEDAIPLAEKEIQQPAELIELKCPYCFASLSASKLGTIDSDGFFVLHRNAVVVCDYCGGEFIMNNFEPNTQEPEHARSAPSRYNDYFC